MIEYLRKRARMFIAYALYYSGALWLIVALRFRRGGVILTYHRVLPSTADTFSADGIIVRPETFARQMKFLRRYFRLLSVEELAAHFESGRPLPPRSCVITFDDGWYDNFEYALPALRAANVPAVVFVATDYIGDTRCFWQERLARYLFVASGQQGAPLQSAERLLQIKLGALHAADRKAAIRNAVDRLKIRSADEIRSIEAELEGALRAANIEFHDMGDDRFMSWDQAAGLTQNSAVSLGSHGCSHQPITTLSEEQATQELLRSRDRITAACSRETLSIAYPNGNYNEQTIQLTKGAGYRIAFSTDRGCLSGGDDRYKLARINISEQATKTTPEFLCALLHIFQRLRRRTPAITNAHPGHR